MRCSGSVGLIYCKFKEILGDSYTICINIITTHIIIQDILLTVLSENKKTALVESSVPQQTTQNQSHNNIRNQTICRGTQIPLRNFAEYQQKYSEPVSDGVILLIVSSHEVMCGMY